MARKTLLRATVSSFIALAATVSLAGCIGGGDVTPSSSPTATVTSPPSATPTPTRSASPTPTVAPTPTPTPSPTAAPITGVSVEILSTSYDPSAGSISVAGIVGDLVSETGVCIATATQDAATASAQSPGVPGPSMTYCSDLTIALPAGAAGTWTVELAYADSSHSGSASTSLVLE
ncbi:hypothetical protein N1028_06870 [Herbiconiux sp. CPCC 203407]|uniref:Uncharacterized protein n=1 Tax=Herbiconiux oxytropis TaxID=2970915 RepID=A0AA42BTW7_9MICO|nr:hypothetical protein [Herbiconiux oxytropis]MCS5722033.1 hypothetical protein [Herbiconiux oxytropis]MCS5725616.1 hypothetical protein [Herbiconiux oxytropis]